MKKKTTLLLIVSLLFVIFPGCNKDYSNYKSEEGYHEYISDSNSGYDDAPYFACKSSMINNEKARCYYKENSRRSGNYIITNYEDGICINKCLGDEPMDIPSEIEGKPVIKVGSYLKNDEVYPAYYDWGFCTMKIPKTVKYIEDNFYSYTGPDLYSYNESMKEFTLITSIQVDTDNPYYTSKNGSLYTKDMKVMLFLGEDAYEVPSTVNKIQPLDGFKADNSFSLKIGKNVSEINAQTYGENDIPQFVIYGNKNTVAKQWAKENNVEFRELKD